MAKTEKKTQKRILLVIILIIIILLLLRLCTSQTQKESTICDTVSDTIVNDKDYLLEDTISVEPIDTIEVEDKKQAKLSSDLVRIDSIESPVLDTTNVVLSKDTIKTDEGLVSDSEPIIIKDTIVVRDTIIVRDTVELEKDVPLGYKTRMFVTLNYAHSFVPTQSSYGFTWGYVEKNLGLYVGFLSNFNFKGLSSDFVIAQEDMSTGFYNGMIETSRFSVNAGLLVGAKSMYFKMGAGYGVRSSYWQLRHNEWAKSEINSFSGFEINTGIHLMINRYVFSADVILPVKNIGDYIETRIGIGVNF